MLSVNKINPAEEEEGRGWMRKYRTLLSQDSLEKPGSRLVSTLAYRIKLERSMCCIRTFLIGR